MSRIVDIDASAVRRAYARWAPIYDLSFGTIAESGRASAVRIINRRQGSVLEVGVGTGLSLPHYASHLRVTGIDLSPEMLGKARERVRRHGVGNVEAILEMDAAELDFDDDSFDTVVAMYVLTVVPDPSRVMAELERVCKPGGEVIVLNHFSQEHGLRGMVEKAMAPLSASLGWRPEFPIETVLDCDRLTLTRRERVWPLGLFTLLRFVKDEKAMPATLGDEEAVPAMNGRPRPVQNEA